MKRSYTLGFRASCFPFARSSTGCTSSEPLAPKVPNLFLAILSIFFTTTNLKRGKGWALGVLQSRPHLEPANRKWSPHICIGEIGACCLYAASCSVMIELTGFSCCINLPCQTWSPNSFGASIIIHSYARIVQTRQPAPACGKPCSATIKASWLSSCTRCCNTKYLELARI